MCGIAVNFDPQRPATPGNLQRLRHRGPDAQGEWVSPGGHLWMGHCRLAIQDLSPRGAQPMTDPATGVTIVFNGEIYNHQKLRNEIGRRDWQGQSDTETLLAAYVQWGDRMLDKLKGMFAFVLYDPRCYEIFAARDRLGIKPLYCRQRDHAWSFASEIGMLCDGKVQLLRETMSGYLKWGAIPDEAQFAPDVRMVPAGHFLRIDRHGRAMEGHYWPKQAIRTQASSSDAPRTVRKLMEKSIGEHLLADVPVSCFLSGGIDSAIIVGLAARQQETPRNLHTFTLAFEQNSFDESATAAKVAKHWGCRHTQVNLKESEVLGFVAEAVAKLDTPSVDAINSYIVCRTAASCGIKVALSGLGADELFGGYPIFKEINLWRTMGRVPRGVRQILSRFGPKARRLANLPVGDSAKIAQWRREFWSDALIAEAGLPMPHDAPVMAPLLPDEFSLLSWTELTGYMRQMLLRDADQMSMANSLELRVPFLDHVLVEYVLGLPQEVKRGRGLKFLLVESCRDLLLAEHFEKPKMGFGLPMREWMLKPLREYVKSGLDHAAKAIPRTTLTRLETQFEADQLHWTRLWSVVVLGHYLNRGACES